MTNTRFKEMAFTCTVSKENATNLKINFVEENVKIPFFTFSGFISESPKV